MTHLLSDLRLGLRMLARHRGFTAVAVLIVGLGIGATTAIFTVVHHVLLRGLPYPEADRLTMIWEDDGGHSDPTPTPGRHQHPASYLNFRDYQRQNRVFASMAAYWQERGTLSGVDVPEEIALTTVSADFFGVMGVNPMRGRTFTPAEDELGQAKVVIVSHALWQRRLGADANVIGKTILLNGEAATVVGVMPQGFGFPETGVRPTDLWIPLNLSADYRAHRNWGCCKVIGRRRPNISARQSEAGMAVVNGNLLRQFPDERANISINLVPLHEQTVGKVRPALMVLVGVVGFVLLIVCANVASLLLVRAGGRQREFAIRAALGAGRWPIVRQLLIESLLLAGLGGIVGLALAWAGVKALILLNPGGLPRLAEIRIDGYALSFSFGLACLSGLLFGVVPALHGSRPDLQQSLKTGGRNTSASRRTRRAGEWLLIGQVALTLVALTSAGLLIRSLAHLHRVEAGFRVDRIVTLPLTVSPTVYPGAEKASQMVEQVLASVALVPGVQASAASSIKMLESRGLRDRIQIEGRTDSEDNNNRLVAFDVVSPTYFQTLEIPLRAGRYFGPKDDTRAPPVVIINETLRRSYWGAQDPLGHRIKYSTDDRWLTVVGVVADTRRAGLDAAVGPESYMPLAQEPLDGSLTLVTRTSADPLAMASAIRKAIWAVDRQLPADNFRTVEQLVSRSLAQRRLTMLLLSLLAAIALVLAAAGIYGLISYTVAQRTQEIGVRKAVGARDTDILALVLKDGMRPVLVGEGLGMVGALLMGRVMAGLLVGVGTADLLTFAATALAMAGVAMVACLAPARQATAVDPITSLRQE